MRLWTKLEVGLDQNKGKQLCSSPAWLASVCLDIMSGKKSNQLENGDTKYHFKMFSDNTPDIIKLDIHYL